MRKLVMAALLGLIVLPMGAAHADPDGCVVVGRGDADEQSCTFDATTTTVSYTVDTPNSWEIWTIRYHPDGTPYKFTFAKGSTLTYPTVADSPFPASLGETINVTMNRDCVSQLPGVCGNAGIVGVFTK